MKPEVLNALNVIIQAANAAQEKGALSLAGASLVFNAIQLLKKEFDIKQEVKDEKPTGQTTETAV